MSQALRGLITELRQGAELSAEGASALQWRKRIAALPAISVSVHGAGVHVIADSARKLLLQRGQVSAQSDEALRGILVELANVLDLELAAYDVGRQNRNSLRRATEWWAA